MVTPLQRDLLDERLRLIGRESSVEAVARSYTDRVLQAWARELRSAARSGAFSGPDRLRRIASLAARMGRITSTEIAALEAALGPILRDAYTQAAFRQVHLLGSGYSAVLDSEAAASFRGFSLPAIGRALSQRVPGITRTVNFSKLSRAAEGRMRQDLAKAIAEGFDLPGLIAKWSSGAGAGLLAREADAVARTALMGSANEATLAVYRANKKYGRMVRHESTFDQRTCLRCSSLHGRTYPIDEAPPLPLHYRCRCVYLFVFSDPDVDKLARREAYITRGGQVRFRAADRKFETWLRQQPVTTRADFFPSALKRRAWENRWLSLEELVARDGSILTDAEVLAKLRRRGIGP